MKQCPNCKTQYTDDTLVYCLQDGTPLAEVFTPGDLPDETATIVSDRTRARAADPTIVTGRPTFERPRPRRTSTVAIVLLTAIATVLIVGFAAIGYVIYSRHKQKEDARFTPDGTTLNTASTPAPKPSATPSPTPSATPSATPTPINKNLITRDVSDA